MTNCIAKNVAEIEELNRQLAQLQELQQDCDPANLDKMAVITQSETEGAARISQSCNRRESTTRRQYILKGQNAQLISFVERQLGMPGNEASNAELIETMDHMLATGADGASEGTDGFSYPAKPLEEHPYNTLVAALKKKLENKITSSVQLVRDGGMPFFLETLQVAFSEVGRVHLAGIFQGQRNITELYDTHREACAAEHQRREATVKAVDLQHSAAFSVRIRC